MNQSKTTQTKKSASKPSNKPSLAKKPAATTRSSRKLPQVAPSQADMQVDIIAAASEGTDAESGARMLPTTTDLPDAVAEDSHDDESALLQETGMDEQRELPVERSPEGANSEGADEDLPSTSQPAQMMESPTETAMDEEEEHADFSASIEERASTLGVADEVGEPSENIANPASDEQIEPTKDDGTAADAGMIHPIERGTLTHDDIEADDVGATATSSNTDAKDVKRRLRSVNPRYTRACQQVSQLRKEFLQALNEKAALLGVERVGEAVPMRSVEMDTLTTEIRDARQKLDELLARKRQLKGATPDVEAINARLREINGQRQVARLEKKAAFEEATKAQSLVDAA